MTLNELYKTYGELMIQAEIINSKLTICKKSIAEVLNNANKKPISVVDDSAVIEPVRVSDKS